MSADPIIPSFDGLKPDDVVRDLQFLPSEPKVLKRLRELLGNANSSVSEIVAWVRIDAGVAMRVLQIANSAVFSKGERCVAVDEAVGRLGFGQIYEVVTQAEDALLPAESEVAEGEVAGLYTFHDDELWQRSVSGALAAEVLAERVGQDTELAHTIGLLHGVGFVAIEAWGARAARGVTLHRSPFPREGSAHEQALLGFTQAEAGAALLRRWGFPGSVIEPVRAQYKPRGAAAHTRMACLLYAAKWLREVVCAGPSVPWPAVPDASILASLGMSASSLQDCLSEVEFRFGEVTTRLNERTLAAASAASA